MTAERERPAGDPAEVPYSEAVEAVRSYYNSDDARRSELGFQELEFIDLTPHLAIHDGRVLDEVRANEQDLLKQCGAEYIQRIKTGLGHWVDGGRRGYLQWGILHSRKN